MKRISFYDTPRKKDKKLHIETELGVINITIGLNDYEGRRVVSIAVSPDSISDNGRKIIREGLANTRLIELLEDEDEID